MILQGKKIVVLGGSSGMGLAVAQAAAKEGGQVIIASRSEQKLEHAKKSIDGDVQSFVLNTGNEEEMKQFFQKIGKFDHLASTAAGGPLGNFLDLDIVDAKKTFEVKYWGQYYAAKYGAPNLNKEGSITFCTGVLSERPLKGTSILSTINGGIEALALALALELGPIRVNVVSPGIVDTPLYGSMSSEDRQAYFNSVSNVLPIPRIAQSEEIAQAFLFLMTNQYTTGTVLKVNGGYPISSI